MLKRGQNSWWIWAKGGWRIEDNDEENVETRCSGGVAVAKA